MSLFEVKRLVNSFPLSVWMHSMVHGKALTRWSTKKADESTVFRKSLNKTPSGKLTNCGILKKMFSNHLIVYKTGGREKFHIYPNALSGMLHLLIGFRNIFGIGRMKRHNPPFFQETVKSGNGAGITALSEFVPKDNKPGIRIASAHIRD